jgi:hypothetical protein
MMEYSTENIERFKWPVSVSRKIEASAQRVWETITRPGNLNDCHPFCEKNPVYQWPGVGSKDAIYYYSGWVLHREIINWIDDVGYDLKIGREGGRKSCVSWRITEEKDDLSTLRITIYPFILQTLPIVFRWIPHIFYIQPTLNNYLESVVKGFEWFITTGIPVEKNQFGSHKWFSVNDE